jgi:hypothetical protein
MEPIDNTKELVKFVPFSSCINPSFWFELNRIKLDDYKLNDDFKNITGFFNNCKNNHFFLLLSYPNPS